MNNIRKVGQTYYARFAIPKDRWPDFEGKRESQRTLQTRDPKEARRRRDKALVAIREELNAYLAARGLRPLDSDWNPDWHAEAERDRQRLARADDTDAVEDPDGSFVPSSKERVFDAITERAKDLDELKGPEIGTAYYKAALGQTTPIGPVSERWLKAEETRLAKQTISQHRYAVRLLGTFLGRGVPDSDPANVLKVAGMESITHDSAAAFMEWLEQDRQTHPKTAGRIHSSLSSLWSWAFKRRLVPENAWTGAATGLKRKARRKAASEGSGKRPYSVDELVRLLRADPNEGRRWTYGAAVFDVMRLSLLTGARANEICSLRLMDIVRSGSGMRVTEAVAKTDNSVRDIPLHALARQIIERRLRELPATDDPAAALFPELPESGPDKKRSWKFTSQFSAWRQKLLGVDDTVDFHSFRRCFATHFEMARAAGASVCTDLVQKDLMGHSRGGVTEGYIGKDLGWKTYAAAIDAMVSMGMPAEVQKALEETKDLRPAAPQKRSQGLRRPTN